MDISFCSNKVITHTKFLDLKETQSPGGTPWFYAHRPNTNPKTDNAVVIAPVIHNADGDTLVFLETRRPPLYAEGKAQTCIELPAGLVGDETKGETIRKAVRKELLEETGYKAHKITIIAKNVSSSAGCTSETSTLAIADIIKDKIFKKPVTDNGINIAIHKIPLNKVDKWLKSQEKSGKAIAAQVYSSLYFIFSRMKK